LRNRSEASTISTLRLRFAGLTRRSTDNCRGEAGTRKKCSARDRRTVSMRVLLEQAFRMRPFGVLPKEGTLRQYYCHAALSSGHRGNHVLDPGVVTIAIRREAKLRAAPHGSDSHASRPHSFSENGGLAMTAVEGCQSVSRGITETLDRAAYLAHDLESSMPCNTRFNSRDGRSGEILLLAVNLAKNVRASPPVRCTCSMAPRASAGAQAGS
jgi:hypothetical protein